MSSGGALFENDGARLPRGGALFKTALPGVPAEGRGVAGSALFENDGCGFSGHASRNPLSPKELAGLLVVFFPEMMESGFV